MLNTARTLTRTLLVSATLMLAMWVAPLRAQADYKIFVDFGSAIPMTSVVKGFEKTGECRSFSFGVARDASPGGYQESPKAQMTKIALTRYLDAASPKLWLRVLNGKTFATVKITLVNSTGVKLAEYVLTNAILASYEVSGSGDDVPFESFELSFSAMQNTVNALDATGKIKSSTTAGWDAVEGVAL